MAGKRFQYFGALTAGLAVSVMLAAPADARRGGSFGSRGSRTHDAPTATATAPNRVAPVQRSMTENRNPAQGSAARSPMAKPAAAKSGGLAKGLIGGLIAGGLIGALLGNGFGSLAGAGFLMALLQIALVGGLAWFLLRMFRRKPVLAAAHSGGVVSPFTGGPQPVASASAAPFATAYATTAGEDRDIPIELSDKAAFERLLAAVQDAFGREDYARLRELTTPEVMSYFAEELSRNATNGRRNQVTGTELIAADVAEAWREGDTDYATIAMRYASIDVMVDRATGTVIEGDPTNPTETAELWTFVRKSGDVWRLSAVQAA